MAVERKHPAAKEPYILYYTVRSSRTLERFCTELAQEKGMKIIRVGGNVLSKMRNKHKHVDYACDLEPREWLYLLNHASCVVTNSFHGTAFSLNYQKDFYVEFSSTANSRLEHIIRTVGLQSRVVKDGRAEEREPIDYVRVNGILDEIRDHSWDYLRRAVGTNDE